MIFIHSQIVSTFSVVKSYCFNATIGKIYRIINYNKRLFNFLYNYSILRKHKLTNDNHKLSNNHDNHELSNNHDNHELSNNYDNHELSNNHDNYELSKSSDFYSVKDYLRKIGFCYQWDPFKLQLQINLKDSLASINDLKTIANDHLPMISYLPMIPSYLSEQKITSNDNLKDYLSHVWSEFSYGKTIDYNQYINCLQKIHILMKNNFRLYYLIKIPFFGAFYVYFKYRKQWDEINAYLYQFVKISIQSKSGFIYSFYKSLINHGYNHTFSEKCAQNHSFLLFFVPNKIYHNCILSLSCNKSLYNNCFGIKLIQRIFDDFFANTQNSQLKLNQQSN